MLIRAHQQVAADGLGAPQHVGQAVALGARTGKAAAVVADADIDAAGAGLDAGLDRDAVG